ncbi:Chromosomal replication initiator protein DnaA (fragment) [Carnobacterium maltaromaticum]
MDDLQSLWNYLKERFKESLAEVSYNTWVKSAHPIRITEQNIIIEVPSSLHKDYWEKNLTTRIVENIYEYSGREISPLFIIKNEQDSTDNSSFENNSSISKKRWS